LKVVRQGAQDYLIKGQVERDLLVRVIRYAIERKQAEERMRQYARRLQILHEIDRAILAAESTEDIAEAALHHIRQLVPCQQSWVITFDFPNEEAVLFAVSANGTTSPAAGTRFPLEETWATEELQRGSAVITGEVPQRGHLLLQSLQSEKTRCHLSVPLLSQGVLIGSLDLGAEKPNVFTPEHVEIACGVADSLAVAMHQAHLHEEVQQHAAELTAAVNRLQELDRLKSELIQNVSHEFRSPLALIFGYAELLANGEMGDITPQQKRTMRIILRQAQALGDLVEDITLMMLAEDRPLIREPVALDQIARAAVEDFRVAADRAEVEIKADIDADLPPVSGMSIYLRRIMDNLISNAIKFTPSGGSVTLRLHGEGDQIIVQVIDTGIGIPADQQTRIFERFYQVDGSSRRRYGGVGLGLALVKELVDAHGGQITVASEEGKGSQFTVRLPVG